MVKIPEWEQFSNRQEVEKWGEGEGNEWVRERERERVVDKEDYDRKKRWKEKKELERYTHIYRERQTDR